MCPQTEAKEEEDEENFADLLQNFFFCGSLQKGSWIERGRRRRKRGRMKEAMSKQEEERLVTTAMCPSH